MAQLRVQSWGNIAEQKKFIYMSLAEPNIRHQELQWRNIGYCIMNGATQEDRNLVLKRLSTPVECRLQVILGNITEHNILVI